jgi:hypothetical protein
METLTIKIQNRKVLKLIHDLEDLNLIQIVGSEGSSVKLSDLLAGCISPEQADIMHKELKQIRS